MAKVAEGRLAPNDEHPSNGSTGNPRIDQLLVAPPESMDTEKQYLVSQT